MTAKTLPNDMNELASMWLAAKKQEEDATADRRDIEDHIKKLATIAENLEGTETIEPGRFEIKIALIIIQITLVAQLITSQR